MLAFCSRIGVPRLFCQSGRPPTFDDPGLKERIRSNPLPKNGRYVVGPVGSHKTHLLTARTVLADRRGHSACLVNWPELLMEARSSYHPGSCGTELGIVNRYADYIYLAIDDFGVGKPDESETNLGTRMAYAIVNARYEKRLVTDFSSNLRPDELPRKFGERIARRVSEMTEPFVMLLEAEKA